MSSQAWWRSGTRFECQGSGGCCVSHGECGAVYLTRGDAQRLAGLLGLGLAQLAERYCLSADFPLQLRDAPGTQACIFLEGKRCSVYAARPTQCRTWPFWPEVMGARQWAATVASFCPGVGKGPLRSAEEIAAALEEQRRADEEIQRDVDEAARRGR